MFSHKYRQVVSAGQEPFFLDIETGPHAALIGCAHHGGTESLVVTKLPPYAPDSGPGFDMTPAHTTGGSENSREHTSTRASVPATASLPGVASLAGVCTYTVRGLLTSPPSWGQSREVPHLSFISCFPRRLLLFTHQFPF